MDPITSGGECSVCLEEKACKSIYAIVQEKYLPSVIEFICGVQLSALDEPDSLVCIQCSMALIQAEEIIQKFLSSQEILKKQKQNFKMEEQVQLKVQNENLKTEEVAEHKVIHEFVKIEYGEKPLDTCIEESEEKCNDLRPKNCKSSCKQRRLKNGELTSTRNRKNDFHFFCDLCSFESDFAKYFRNHMMEVHKVEKPRIFKCHHCNEAYVEYRSLQNHIAHVHECKPRKCKFLCSECGKGFGKHSHLVQHSYVHNPEKRPFRCDFCPMLFVNQSCVQRHMVASHSDDKPFTCEICGNTFGNIYCLRAHLKRVHTVTIKINKIRRTNIVHKKKKVVK